jgi:hypothetical protein
VGIGCGQQPNAGRQTTTRFRPSICGCVIVVVSPLHVAKGSKDGYVWAFDIAKVLLLSGRSLLDVAKYVLPALLVAVRFLKYLPSAFWRSFIRQLAFGTLVYFAARSAVVWYQGSDGPVRLERYDFLLLPGISDLPHQTFGAKVSFFQALQQHALTGSVASSCRNQCRMAVQVWLLTGACPFWRAPKVNFPEYDEASGNFVVTVGDSSLKAGMFLSTTLEAALGSCFSAR